jgi:hypothetical protein
MSDPVDTKRRTPQRWPRGVRSRVYEAITLERWKSNGYGYEMHESLKDELRMLQDQGRFEAALDRQSEAFRLYTNSALDRLHGMIAVAALVEGKTEVEIREKVFE